MSENAKIERGIPFMAPMVRAVLVDPKRQTSASSSRSGPDKSRIWVVEFKRGTR